MAKVIAIAKAVPQETTPSDAAARTAALDVRASCIVEAPAGSGKTGLLVQRFLKLLADEAVETPEEILAITFTRKATAEMHERVLEQLQSADEGIALSEDSAFARDSRALAEAALLRSRKLGWNLLAQPQRLNIRSILSVCMDLANSRPLLTDSVGPQQPVEYPGPLYQMAARNTLLQLGGPDRDLNRALQDLLLHRDGSITDCERLIAGMLHTREQWSELVPLGRNALGDAFLDGQVRPRLEQTLSSIVCAGLTRAQNTIPPNVLLHLTQFAHRHAHLPGYNGRPSPIVQCAGKQEPPSAVAEHLDHWRALIGLVIKPSDRQWRASLAINTLGFKPQKSEVDEFKLFIVSIQNDALRDALDAVLDLPSPNYPDEQWAVAKSLFRILNHALAELKLLFAARGECDFSEFSLTARESLGAGGEITDFAIAAGGKLRHLLVDEMQDTSTGQYDLIRLLTQSWDGHSQTLFLVGDPKQSIYLFRQARVERFLRTMQEERFGEIPLVPLRLSANFRSQAALVQGFNNTFGGTAQTEPIFPPPGQDSHEDLQAEVPFVAATATREQTQTAGIEWHATIHEEADRLDENFNLEADEAREIRNIIQQRLMQPLPPGRTRPWSIAVLARARNHLSAIVKELNAHAIAFRGVDLDPLNECPEVQDVLALTRALLHPADRIAWLAVLHAPWCGLGIADLLALTGEGVDTDSEATVSQLIASRRHLLTPSGQQLLNRVWPILAAAADTLGRTTLAVHLERTWRSLGGDLMLSTRRQTNVLRFLAVLREVEVETDGQVNILSALTARVDNLFAEPGEAGAPIELMTIHKAKGLEWDLVLVPGLHRKPRRSGGILLNWLELDDIHAEESASIVLAPIWGKGDDSDKLNDWLKDIRNRRDRAEEKRLFYVACTRAREELHLFAAANRNSDGEITLPASGSLLKACWPAAQPYFATQADSVGEEVEEDYTLALAAAAAPAPPPRKPPALPTVQRLPLSFDPYARFAEAAAHRLDYPSAAALQRSPAFDRPEGSFAVRAFGNVVHRYLQVLSKRLADGITPAALLDELPSWTERLTASLRGEGLPISIASREAVRALRGLTLTLDDPTGRWILCPHATAASESALSTIALSLRVDRTFLAGDEPLSSTADCIWIVDFKTTDPGSRSPKAFEAAERAKYSAQLEAYATIRRTQPDGHLPIRLGLYYPLAPRLLHWPSAGSELAASDNQ